MRATVLPTKRRFWNGTAGSMELPPIGTMTRTTDIPVQTSTAPAFSVCLADIKAGKIKRVIVKDMSRFGRDYLQVGFYTDMLFPDFGVHFIAVNDGVDSTRGENEFTAIRNVFNEMYARDTSKKIRATWQSKGKSGEHLTTIPPYGYMKDPDNKKKWIIDEEAAAVVQQIFALCVSGMGPTQICHWLEKSEILNPTFYWLSKGMKVGNKPKPGANPYKWTNETVSRMLEKIEYLGHTVNFKTRKQSYKSKKKLWNDPSEWVIFENTQPPIVEESVFLIVQNIRRSRRRPTKMGDMGIFSGLLYCAECGGKMYQCRATNFTEEQKYFICSTYRKGKDLCTTHSIKNVVLHEIVLRNSAGSNRLCNSSTKPSLSRKQQTAVCESATRSFPASAKHFPKPKAGLPSWITCSSIYTRTM